MEFVESYEEVKKNIQQFNKDLKEGSDIRTQFSQFKHWYYLDDIGMFGPSKYIGYKNINASNYMRGHGLDGRDTEEVLLRWFRKVEKGTKEESELKQRLNLLLNRYGKKIRTNVCIHV